ncbi:uncharacterized protein B0T15DRAFT_572536 [Chaetomium strumarium]|uniref:Uncharacterized protein n=1 Tax=Chaetomium strumarium TaxID=1170767 RepID=A0AAJ0GYA4_9PEZI|nr:hypothetical protein B0T15DRAFT_572536 [Chaetomium strumarium]
MANMIHSLTLLSLGTSMAFAWGIGNRSPHYPVYGGHSQLQPGITSTVTTTQVTTITVGAASCDAVYIPTTTTVLPCTHGPISSGLSPGNSISSSAGLGWNSSILSTRPTLAGTGRTTIETAKPVNTSLPPVNSTATFTTESDATVVVTVTLTSSAVATVGVSVTSGQPIGVPSSSAYSNSGTIGTDSPRNTSAGISTSYQPSMTYKTTSSAPPSLTSATPSNSTSKAIPVVSSANNTLTTATNKPLNTTAGLTSVAPVGPSSSTGTGSDTTLASPFPSTTSSTAGDDNGGEYGYGGYTYSFASPTTPSSVPISFVSDTSSVDAIGATTTTNTASTSTSTSGSGSVITDSTLDHPTATSPTTSSTATGSAPATLITITTQAAASSSLAGDGGYGDGYGYGVTLLNTALVLESAAYTCLLGFLPLSQHDPSRQTQQMSSKRMNQRYGLACYWYVESESLLYARIYIQSFSFLRALYAQAIESLESVQLRLLGEPRGHAGILWSPTDPY